MSEFRGGGTWLWCVFCLELVEEMGDGCLEVRIE